MAFPIERNEWAVAVEFVWHDWVDRTEFDLRPLLNARNYGDCSAASLLHDLPASGAVRLFTLCRETR